MRRAALFWMLAGAAPAALVATVVHLYAERKPALFFRIADDNLERMWEIEDRGNQGQIGSLSAKIVHGCGISRFEHYSTFPDYTGSTFVEVAENEIAKLNCVVGEARINGLTVAIVRGIARDPIECLPGNPARFQPPEYFSTSQAAYFCGLRPRTANAVPGSVK